MKILSLSLDLELAALRRAILTDAGHEVTSLTTEKNATAAAQSSEQYDAALLCHRLPASAARQVIRLLRQHHPGTRVIYIARVYGEWPEVEADRYVVGADGPVPLLRVLEEIRSEATSVTRN
jgi:DNA-binding response OmpR family regulator